MNCLKIDKIRNSKGFTLIEVILTLVVAGILAVMLISVYGYSYDEERQSGYQRTKWSLSEFDNGKYVL